MDRQPNLDAGPDRCAYAGQPAQRPHCQLTAVIRYGTIPLCSDCDARRSTLGKGVRPHRLPTQEPLDVMNWVAQADQHMRQARKELAAAVQRARTQGHTWNAIGTELNTTRQAAQQRFTQDHPAGG